MMIRFTERVGTDVTKFNVVKSVFDASAVDANRHGPAERGADSFQLQLTSRAAQNVRVI